MNFELARRQMLRQQIRTWDVLDPLVLETLGKIKRESFVPEAERDLAFADTEIPLLHGQCMLAPKVEARLLQELAIRPSDLALQIGTGSGYLAACMGRLAERVQSLEIFSDLCNAARANLAASGSVNVEVINEDATQAGFTTRFDVVAVTASVPTLSERWVRLLKPNGRLFIVVGRPPVMEALLVRMDADGSTTEKSLFETLLTPMINADQSRPFVL
jgi:protein-L-isoaspartate(D-aspartate) O-methyltransferase